MISETVKIKLIEKLYSLTDETIFNKISDLLKDIDINVEPYKLNPEQILMVNEGLEDYKAGRTYTDEEVNREEQEWLKNL